MEISWDKNQISTFWAYLYCQKHSLNQSGASIGDCSYFPKHFKRRSHFLLHSASWIPSSIEIDIWFFFNAQSTAKVMRVKPNFIMPQVKFWFSFIKKITAYGWKRQTESEVEWTERQKIGSAGGQKSCQQVKHAKLLFWPAPWWWSLRRNLRQPWAPTREDLYLNSPTRGTLYTFCVVGDPTVGKSAVAGSVTDRTACLVISRTAAVEEHSHSWVFVYIMFSFRPFSSRSEIYYYYYYYYY